MTEANPGYTASPNDEPQTLSDYQDRVAELECELERAYAAGDSICDLMVATWERRELQLLRKEHEALREYLADAADLFCCPVCFGHVWPSGEIKHDPNCRFVAIERFLERHG